MGHTIVPVTRAETIVTVPEDVIQELEEFYAYLALPENAGQAGLVTFDTAEEANTWVKQARSYLGSREAGALAFRKLRTDSLGDTQLRFTIKAMGEEKPRGHKPAAKAAAK